MSDEHAATAANMAAVRKAALRKAVLWNFTIGC
jgi:hypothetical protein